MIHNLTYKITFNCCELYPISNIMIEHSRVTVAAVSSQSPMLPHNCLTFIFVASLLPHSHRTFAFAVNQSSLFPRSCFTVAPQQLFENLFYISMLVCM